MTPPIAAAALAYRPGPEATAALVLDVAQEHDTRRRVTPGSVCS
jgi:hypothetical protein